MRSVFTNLIRSHARALFVLDLIKHGYDRVVDAARGRVRFDYVIIDEVLEKRYRVVILDLLAVITRLTLCHTQIH